MTIALLTPPRIVAHRGFSSRQPEMTLAAYQEAIEWSRQAGVPVGLECDVQLSADGQLVCLHDPSLERTGRVDGQVADWMLAELRGLDFGSWKLPHPTAPQRSLVTLAELLSLVHDARLVGTDVTLVIETKHEAARGTKIEQQVCRMLANRGWDRRGAPIRLISLSVPAAVLLAQLVPEVERTLLIGGGFPPYASGELASPFLTGKLPPGVHVVGIDVKLLRRDPGFVDRAHLHGNEVHAWTVNEPEDIEFCRAIGVTEFTSDHPDRVLEVLSRTEPARSAGAR